jgi:hypothetical protein
LALSGIAQCKNHHIDVASGPTCVGAEPGWEHRSEATQTHTHTGVLGRLSALRRAIVRRAAALVAAVQRAWMRWPGIILRWVTATLFFSTVLANALAVPFANAQLVPRAEYAVSHLLHRSVFVEGVRWVSPPGLLGMGPVVSLDGVTVGPRLEERSHGSAAGATIHIRPLPSLLQRKVVLDIDVQRVDVTLCQAQNFSWFGYPEDTLPSARDFVPGLSDDSAWEPGSDGPRADDSIGSPGAPSDADLSSASTPPVQTWPVVMPPVSRPASFLGWRAAPHVPEASSAKGSLGAQLENGARSCWGRVGLRQPQPQEHDAFVHRNGHAHLRVLPSANLCDTAEACTVLEGAAAGSAQSCRFSGVDVSPQPDPTAPPPLLTAPPSHPARQFFMRRSDSVASLMQHQYKQRGNAGTPPVATAAHPSAVAPFAALPGQQAQQDELRPPPVALRCITVSDSVVHAYTFGDAVPREFTNVNGHITFGPGYHMLEVAVHGDAQEREASTFVCTMPTRQDARNLRDSTLGAGTIPQVHYPITTRGPSPSSLAKLRQPPGQPDSRLRPSEIPLAARPLAAPGAKPQSPSGRSARPGEPSGGRITVLVSASDILVDGVWPVVNVSVRGNNLHAPLLDRLLELPMDIYGGRLDGNVDMHMHHADHWMGFPGFSGRIAVADASFHFWDSPDDFTGTEMSLLFDEDTMHVLSGRGAYGAVQLSARGEVRLDPAHGQYNIQVDAPAVEVNALRATLGVRPFPYPMAGAVSGHMQCYGALEEPVFAGRVDAVAAQAGALDSGPKGEAHDALLQALKEGKRAVLAYDKVPIRRACSF